MLVFQSHARRRKAILCSRNAGRFRGIKRHRWISVQSGTMICTFPDVWAPMERGIELDIYLKPGLHEEDFIARAIGNLAAYKLQKDRDEPLEWQVLRIDGSEHHHFRLIVRHPQRRLDIGIKHDLSRILEVLSNESVDQLRERLLAAEREGLKPVPLRRAKAQTDFWQDDFWNWIG